VYGGGWVWLLQEVEALKAQVAKQEVEKRTLTEHMNRVKAIHSDQIKAMASRQLQLQSQFRDSKRANGAVSSHSQRTHTPFHHHAALL